jgi:3-hydroxy-9,10-secoandrosta-1,3,5(10)-triene-9,17-dione monooxygenase reductase component
VEGTIRLRHTTLFALGATPLSAVISPLDSQSLRRVLGSFATGVTVITTRDAQGRSVGLTVNSFNTVSLDPPLVLWSLRLQAGSMAVFRDAGHWAVHVLAHDQQALSERFSRRGDEDRFAGLSLGRGHGGVPLLAGCAAVLQCRAVQQHAGGDHLIFIGEVLECAHRPVDPLIFHAGQYAHLRR